MAAGSALKLPITVLASEPALACASIAVQQIVGAAVMQEEEPLADAPERRRAELVAVGLPLS